MKIFSAIVLTLMAVIPGNVFGALVEWSVASGGNGHYYEAVQSDPITWGDAEAAAQARGGYLAVITTSAENDFVFSLINTSDYWLPWYSDPSIKDGPWIGGYKDLAGNWKWVNGEPFDYSNWWTQEEGAGWNQPDGSGNRIHFWTGPGYSSLYGPFWDDKGDAINIAGYVVEYSALPEPVQPPDVSKAYPSVGCLWPPNNKFVDVTIKGVTDPDGEPVAISITSITSDEPTASMPGAGGPKAAPDAFGVGTTTASLRAERGGGANGRVYEITFEANDGRGGIATGKVRVCMPHDMGGTPAIDDGQNYDATQIN